MKKVHPELLKENPIANLCHPEFWHDVRTIEQLLINFQKQAEKGDWLDANEVGRLHELLNTARREFEFAWRHLNTRR